MSDSLSGVEIAIIVIASVLVAFLLLFGLWYIRNQQKQRRLHTTFESFQTPDLTVGHIGELGRAQNTFGQESKSAQRWNNQKAEESREDWANDPTTTRGWQNPKYNT